MTERLEKIFSVIPSVKVFADVGCDHGYIAKAMIDCGKCERVIISDISQKCLSKAEALLNKEIKEGKAVSVVSDGLKNLPVCDLALIAGMGGEEIINILSDAPYLPQGLVLQPMKNPQKVRVFAVKTGYKILKDFTFYSGDKYYDLMLLTKGQDTLTEEEIEHGRTNITEKSPDFKRKITWQIGKIDGYLEGGNLKEEERLKKITQREKLLKYV